MIEEEDIPQKYTFQSKENNDKIKEVNQFLSKFQKNTLQYKKKSQRNRDFIHCKLEEVF